MDNLKPCPFCGSDDLNFREPSSQFGDVGYVKCLNCLSKTPFERWNTRATLRVKPLVWGEDGYGMPETKKTPLGIYRISHAGNGGYVASKGSVILNVNGTSRTNFDTVDLAKQASQDHHERTILDQLEPCELHDVEKLRAAIQSALKIYDQNKDHQTEKLADIMPILRDALEETK